MFKKNVLALSILVAFLIPITVIAEAVFDQMDVMGAGKSGWHNQARFKYFKYKI